MWVRTRVWACMQTMRAAHHRERSPIEAVQKKKTVKRGVPARLVRARRACPRRCRYRFVGADDHIVQIYFRRLFGACRRASAEGPDRIGGWRRRGLGEARLWVFVRIDTGPRRSPSACSEMLERKNIGSYAPMTGDAKKPTTTMPAVASAALIDLTTPPTIVFGRFSIPLHRP